MLFEDHILDLSNYGIDVLGIFFGNLFVILFYFYDRTTLKIRFV